MSESKDQINAYLEEFQPDSPRSIDVVKTLVDGKERIEVTFRQEFIEPTRAESPARCHRFFSLEAFITYLDSYAENPAGSLVLGDPHTGKIVAVLDEKATDGFEMITYEPVTYPLFVPWERQIGIAMKIRDMADFIMANRGPVVKPEPMELPHLFNHVSISQNVELQTGVGARGINGVLVEYKAQGGKPEGRRVDLPEQLTLRCPIFIDSEPQQIVVDLRIQPAGEGAVKATLYCPALPEFKLKAVQGMLARIDEKVAAATVGLGEPRHTPWEYVRNQATPVRRGNEQDW